MIHEQDTHSLIAEAIRRAYAPPCRAEARFEALLARLAKSEDGEDDRTEPPERIRRRA